MLLKIIRRGTADCMWNDERVSCFDALVDDGRYLWFPSAEYNALYKYDKNSNSTEYIGSFKGEKDFAFRLYSDIYQVGQKFYFSPSYAKEIGVYNREKGVFDSIPLQYSRNDCHLYFSSIKEYGDFLYMVSTTDVPVILELEKKTHKITYYDHWYMDKAASGKLIANEILLKDGVLYIPFNQSNTIMKFDLRLKSFSYFKIGMGTGGFNTICYDGNVFWLTSRDSVISWDGESGCCQIYDNFPQGFGTVTRDEENPGQVKFTKGITGLDKRVFPFGHSLYAAGFIWLFPYITNMVVKVDIMNGNMEEFPLSEETEDRESLYRERYTHEKFPCVHLFGDRIYACSTKRTLLYSIDPYIGSVEEILVKISEPSYLHLFMEKISDGKEGAILLYEDGKYTNLRSFIEEFLLSGCTLHITSDEVNYGIGIHAYTMSGGVKK